MEEAMQIPILATLHHTIKKKKEKPDLILTERNQARYQKGQATLPTS